STWTPPCGSSTVCWWAPPRRATRSRPSRASCCAASAPRPEPRGGRFRHPRGPVEGRRDLSPAAHRRGAHRRGARPVRPAPGPAPRRPGPGCPSPAALLPALRARPGLLVALVPALPVHRVQGACRVVLGGAGEQGRGDLVLTVLEVHLGGGRGDHPAGQG